MKKRTQQEIRNFLDNLLNVNLVMTYNAYAEEVGYETINDMDEFDDICSGMTPTDIANRIYYGDGFCPNHSYFWFDGLGNLTSFDDPTDAIDDCVKDDMAEYIYESETDLGLYDLGRFLDGEDIEQ